MATCVLKVIFPTYGILTSSRFTPSDVVDMSKERDWPSSLGMLSLLHNPTPQHGPRSFSYRNVRLGFHPDRFYETFSSRVPEVSPSIFARVFNLTVR